MQRVGVLFVICMSSFFVSMILLNAFGVIDENVSVYETALAATVVVVAVGLFASSIKAWPTWAPS